MSKKSINFAPIKKTLDYHFTQMKTFQRLSVLLVVLALSFTSCDWDNSPEPPHPTYVTYTISALAESFEGPQALQLDIEGWIKKNAVIYDRKVDYSTGDVSEFAKHDPEALKNYESFKPKFIAYLNELKGRINNGGFGNDISKAKAQATFIVYAERSYGDSNKLKSEKVEFSYP